MADQVRTIQRNKLQDKVFCLFAAAFCLIACLGLFGCGDSGSVLEGAVGVMSDAADKAVTAVGAKTETGETTGAAFKPKFTNATFNSEKAESGSGAMIDTSSVAAGYVGAKFESSERLKFQVTCAESTYNYDLPSGKATIYPLNMGSGTYTFSVLQNTSGKRYVTVFSTTAEVSLSSEQAPFLVPNVFCNYKKKSDCVAKAKEVTAKASNQAEALQAVYNYVVNNISYDKEKAEELSGGSGYIPNPDETLETGKGVCFDYSSLVCAMLRSQGIPCKIITGYVGDNDIYHAWNMVYIDGTWKTIKIDVKKKKWSRIDTTFASAGAGSTVGDGTKYRERYEY